MVKVELGLVVLKLCIYILRIYTSTLSTFICRQMNVDILWEILGKACPLKHKIFCSFHEQLILFIKNESVDLPVVDQTNYILNCEHFCCFYYSFYRCMERTARLQAFLRRIQRAEFITFALR